MGRRVSNQGDRGENRKYLIREIPKNKQAANWQQINFKIKKKKGEHQSRYLKIRKIRKKHMQQIWKLRSTKIRKVWQWKSTMTDENINHGCLLPCNKTWLSDVRTITNDRIFFRGRFRGRLIKIDAHRPSRALAIGCGWLTFPWCTPSLTCWDFSQEQAMIYRASPSIAGAIFKLLNFTSCWATIKNHLWDIISPNYLSHKSKKLWSWPQIRQCGLKCSPVMESWGEMAHTESPDSQKSRD